MSEPKRVGRYTIVRSLGRGGMGEVFLAFDPVCGREVALKQIREEMRGNATLQERFLREAKIPAQLSHPSIVPVYSIEEAESPFYTMAHIEGETLKQIVRTSRTQEEEGKVDHPIGESIPALARIFLTVCEAIAYAHSKGVLHRDIKLENIIVGKYGQVFLLDWGVASFLDGEEENLPTFSGENTALTKIGKITGTISYMAPERLSMAPASVGTDIYSLGVILYYLLTLRAPFHRPSVKAFRKTVHIERLLEPQEIAPYRNIPQHLADIAKKCLEADPQKRYQTVWAIITELKTYTEGRPKWVPVATLDMNKKEDWEFQENICLAKHMAISQIPDVMEWVSLMLSEASFSTNIHLHTRVRSTGAGIGFLIGVPEAFERKSFEEGFCLWIGKSSSKLFLSGMEVMQIPQARLRPNCWHEILIEKIDNHLRWHLDGKLCCDYIHHVPLQGKKIGLLYRDGDFSLEGLSLSVRSQNVQVSCLAVPDAFFASKNYTKALHEYRQIGSSFSGRWEGQEALFRAGITLLEEAATKKKKQEKQRLQTLAFEEFSKLRTTPAAPLEYLGKALLYQSSEELEEEMKSLELCVRKYPKHPLRKIITEHILFRLHETSEKDRTAAFHYALLALTQLPSLLLASEDNQRLIHTLQHHLPLPPFFTPAQRYSEGTLYTHMAIQLAFCLAKPVPLIEILETNTDPTVHMDAALALLALGHHKWMRENLSLFPIAKQREALEWLLHLQKKRPSSPYTEQVELFHIDHTLKTGDPRALAHYALPLNHQIERSLLLHDFANAQALLATCSEELLATPPLFFFYAAWLWHQEGEKQALAYLGRKSDPLTKGVLSTLEGTRKLPHLFFWEKISLFHHLRILYECAQKPKRAHTFATRLRRASTQIRERTPNL